VIRRGSTDRLPVKAARRQTTPEQGNHEPAAQRPERRCRKIPDGRVPTGREVLEVLHDAGV